MLLSVMLVSINLRIGLVYGVYSIFVVMFSNSELVIEGFVEVLLVDVCFVSWLFSVIIGWVIRLFSLGYSSDSLNMVSSVSVVKWLILLVCIVYVLLVESSVVKLVKVRVMLVSIGSLLCINGWLVWFSINGRMGRMYGLRMVSVLFR